MAEDTQPARTAMVFIIEPDDEDRERIRSIVAAMGCVGMPLPGIDAAVDLFANGAICDLIILDTEVMDGDPGRFDELLAAVAPAKPGVILYGVDPAAKIALHCLTLGANDFLTKPINDEDLRHAVDHIALKDAGHAPDADAIVASSHVAGWIELTASSELEQFRRLQRFSDALFASRLPQQVCEDLKLAVEEVGRNAVEWGNRFDPDKQVHVSYCMFSDRVVIKVEDEGEGFCPQALPDPTADPMKTMQDRVKAGKRPGGYGVFLIQKLVDDIVYNEKGNTVLMIKYLPV